jgi:5-amino-6-(5-phospho-D-ribitylamino)uracil phosphatase
LPSIGDGVVLKFKLLAIDLDGTLLSPSGVVSPRTRQAVHHVLAAGFRICFATGRNLTESLDVLEAVGHFDPAVFVGGAFIYDTRKKVTLHRTLMHPDLARELCAFFESHGEAALALQDTHTAGVDYLASRDFDLHSNTEKWMKATRSVLKRAPDMAKLPHNHTMRVSIVTDLERGTNIRAQLNQAFGSRIISHSFTSMFNNVAVVEAFDPTVNKWQGIIRVADQFKILPSEIVAVGDDVNDVPMIKNAGLGVAMGNATPETQSAAAKIIGKNADDGLAVFLEELAAKPN